MRFENQLKIFLRILDEYSQDVPLPKFLPVFFRANKQMGSTDRRLASRLLYNYFRIGKALPQLAIQERLFIAEFLCNTVPCDFLAYFKPELNEKIELTVDAKISYLKSVNLDFNMEDVFPFYKHFSAGINKNEFLQSFFVQPDLFIRIHPGKENLIKAALTNATIAFVEETNSILRLPNGTKLDTVFNDTLAWYEVQDLSSQQTGNYFKPQRWDYWWDCCAASGGKSLLLFHQQPDIKLVVSDIRESVLENLDVRFAHAGLLKYQKKILDLTQNPDPILHDFSFDGIILDAPCSGSGTWGRSPEMISQFKESKIASFQHLQRSIIRNVVKYLKAGKPFIYITCSCFKEENEANVEFIINELGFTLENQQLIKGYQHKADTMFVARFIR